MSPAAPRHQADETAALLRELGDRDGLDLAAYSPTSLLRRVRRRMEQAGVHGLRAYRALLAADPDEYHRLCEAVPVHRTEFFRDPDSWAYLAAEVVPGLLAAKPAGGPVRVWCAGCATGEEAYTLAVLLAEALGPEALADGRLKVFATDVSERAVAAARAGRYRAEELAAVPAGLRGRYFHPDATGRAVVRPELRRCVVFARHDLLRDPPFSRLDLIACRNTIMYFTPEHQGRVLARLYLGLRPGGVLFTGPAERPTVWSGLFEPLGGRHRVYRRAADGAGEALAVLARRPSALPPPRAGGPSLPRPAGRRTYR